MRPLNATPNSPGLQCVHVYCRARTADLRIISPKEGSSSALVRTTTSPVTIDHVFIRNNNLIHKTETCEGINDHTGIYCIINKDVDIKYDDQVRCRSFKNLDEKQFQEDIV